MKDVITLLRERLAALDRVLANTGEAPLEGGMLTMHIARRRASREWLAGTITKLEQQADASGTVQDVLACYTVHPSSATTGPTLPDL